MTTEKIIAAATKSLNFLFSTRSRERGTSYKALKTLTGKLAQDKARIWL